MVEFNLSERIEEENIDSFGQYLWTSYQTDNYEFNELLKQIIDEVSERDKKIDNLFREFIKRLKEEIDSRQEFWENKKNGEARGAWLELWSLISFIDKIAGDKLI